MATTEDARGNLHRGKGAPGAGEFTDKPQSAPELTLTRDGFLPVNGPPVETVYVASTYTRGLVPLSVSDAKKSLSIPADEPIEVLRATVTLLAGSTAHPGIAMYPDVGYADPGEDATIDMSDWQPPAEGMAWSQHGAQAWADSGLFTVVAPAVFSLEELGFGPEQSDAAVAAAADFVYAHPEFGATLHDHESVSDTADGVHIGVVGKFNPSNFSPALVERELAWQVKAVDPRQQLKTLKASGIVIGNDDLKAARNVNGRAAAYAAASGRVPTDAEAVAIAREFNVHNGLNTLADGYLMPARVGQFALPQIDPAALTAIRSWIENRI